MAVQTWKEARTTGQQTDLHKRTLAKLEELSDLAKSAGLVKHIRVASASTGELGPAMDFFIEPDGTFSAQRSRVLYGEREWGRCKEENWMTYTADELRVLSLTPDSIQRVIDEIKQ